MHQEIVGHSPAFQHVLNLVGAIAKSDSVTLIQGETGTGKELVARAIHELSPCCQAPFIKLNCAAIPAALLESELFGHERGAFTGAVVQHTPGRFQPRRSRHALSGRNRRNAAGIAAQAPARAARARI